LVIDVIFEPPTVLLLYMG